MTLLTTRTGRECDKPHCHDPQYRTYTDEHGNRLVLCESHYFQVVADDTNYISIE